MSSYFVNNVEFVLGKKHTTRCSSEVIRRSFETSSQDAWKQDVFRAALSRAGFDNGCWRRDQAC